MRRLWVVFLLLTAPLCSSAAVREWDGSADSNWFNQDNWTPVGVPAAGDSVTVSNSASITLTNDTTVLSSFTITNATLVFTNWYTALTATNVYVLNGGTLTHAQCDTNAAVANTNRVHIICTNFTLAAGGLIDADGLGYAALQGRGAGIKSYRCTGAGHGGKGGRGRDSLGTGPYGSLTAPTDPGSGGGEDIGTGYGGSGGGAVLIEASGTVTIDGTITAYGGAGAAQVNAGGGSGGSIHITCGTFVGGSGGILRVDGGDAGKAAYYYSGAGGGGRMAVDYTSASVSPGFSFSGSPGIGRVQDTHWYEWRDIWWDAPDMGTLYLSDASLLSESLGDLFLEVRLTMGTGSWSVNSLTVTNCSVVFENGFVLTVTNNVLIGTNGYLGLGDFNRTGISTSYLYCGQDLIVTNGGILDVFSGATNGATGDYGALVSVTGAVRTGVGGWIRPYSQKTNGGSVFFYMTDLEIGQNSGINADARGFTSLKGPAQGQANVRYGGSGHGGKGGRGAGAGAAGGPTYGSTNAPMHAGSGAVVNRGSSGGGCVRIEATGNVAVNGTIAASGVTLGNGNKSSGNVGAAGGAIFIMCASFSGDANGVLRAMGGNAHSSYQGGGGGGRIAVAVGLSGTERADLVAGNSIDGLHVYDSHVGYGGIMSVTNGIGYGVVSDPPNGAQPGTKVFLTTTRNLTIQGDPANYGNPGPNLYGTTVDLVDSSWITNSLSTPVDQTNGMRHACFGWDLRDVDGGAVDSDTTTQAVFLLTTNLVLTWKWTNEYELAVSASANGSATTSSNGWYTNGYNVTGIMATPSNGYVFLLWTGDVPAGKETDNPLDVTMDRARTITGQFASTNGETKIWTGVGSWLSMTNWSPAGMPGPYDDAIVESGTVTLGIPRTMRSLSVSNSATVVLTNWSTSLTVSNILIQNGATITLPGPFDEDQMSNRVHIICTDFTLAAGGLIDADGLGYAALQGPGAGVKGTRCTGAGHGGKGGRGSSKLGTGPYGSLTAPTDPGSGGGQDTGTGYGGGGGGAVRIEASGTVTIDGMITADGDAGAAQVNAGGGSGGSIHITCGTFVGGSGGILRVDGGDAGKAAYYYSGAGGGGRMAVDYTSASVSPGFSFSTSPGIGRVQDTQWYEWRDIWWDAPDMGTLYLSDASLLSESLGDDLFSEVRLTMGTGSWSVNSLTVTNCSVVFENGFIITVTNSILIGTNGYLGLGDFNRTGISTSYLYCGQDLIVTNGGILDVFSGATNGATGDYGALVSVAGAVRTGVGGWIRPCSQKTNGGSVFFYMTDLEIGQNSGINADARGFTSLKGPAQGQANVRYGGSGHGGKGGRGAGAGAAGGPTYGSTNAPMHAGSGAVVNRGSSGGGCVRIEATGNVAVNGTIAASGVTLGNGNKSSGNVGAAGGAIFIMCASFSGDVNGVLRAMGGNAHSSYQGGGGGGRIAVWYSVPQGRRAGITDGSDMRRVLITSAHEDFAGVVSVTNGIGYGVLNDPPNGAQPGTIVFLTIEPPAGTVFLIR